MNATRRIRTAIMLSGRGTNMVALLDAASASAFPAEIVTVVSNRADAPGLEIARSRGVEALAIPHKAFGRDREAHEREIDKALRDRGVGLICLAGYMRLLTPFFVQSWAGRMINIHPSLLPDFPGLETHRRAIEAGAARHGCTVHVVTEVMDEGPILDQESVPVLPGDDAESLAARVLAREHVLYPRALAAYATNLLQQSLAGIPHADLEEGAFDVEHS